MGRPERRDVDYFPFYIKDGRTLFILENKYQCKGTGFFTNVMRFLSRTPDHHFQIEKESDKLYFFATVKCDEVSGLDMIEIMIETQKLDRDCWEQKKVIACQDYLLSIQDAYRKRLNECITMDEIKMLYGITTGRNGVTAGVTTPDSDIECITTGDKPQSKVKETIQKKKDIYAQFEKFWAVYPNKKAKGNAEKSFFKINPDDNLMIKILTSIGQAKKTEDWTKEGGKFIPHPASWLNAKRWEDEFKVNGSYKDPYANARGN